MSQKFLSELQHKQVFSITYDETKAVEISEKKQLGICQKVNGQFCSINSPLQPMANPPLYIAAQQYTQ